LLAEVRAAGDLIEVRDHRVLNLLTLANGLHASYAVRKAAAVQQLLVGECFFVKERLGVFGQPQALWNIPPHWIAEMPTPSRPAYRVAFSGWHGFIPAGEIFAIVNLDPANPYGRGIGLAQVLGDELEADEMAARTVKQQFLNGARPDFLVYPKTGQQASPAEVARLRQTWEDQHEGFWRAARPHFASRELGIHEFAQVDNRALQMVQLRGYGRDLTRETVGVPPEILGHLENSNRATITASINMHARGVLVPRLELYRSAVQEFLIPEFDDRWIVDYESPVVADKELQLQAAAVAPWSLTLDEWRAMTGHGPLPDGEGTQRLVPFQLSPSEPGPGGMDTSNLRSDERAVLTRAIAMGARLA